MMKNHVVKNKWISNKWLKLFCFFLLVSLYFRAPQFIFIVRHCPALAAGGGHTHQEVPPQSQRLERPHLTGLASGRVCGVCYGPGLYQEWPVALSRDGAEPGTLQHWTKLLILQVGSDERRRHFIYLSLLSLVFIPRGYSNVWKLLGRIKFTSYTFRCSSQSLSTGTRRI